MYIEVDLVEHFRPHDFSWQLGNLTRCRLVMAALPSASEWPEKRNAGVSFAPSALCSLYNCFACCSTMLCALCSVAPTLVVCAMLSLVLSAVQGSTLVSQSSAINTRATLTKGRVNFASSLLTASHNMTRSYPLLHIQF